MRDVADATSLIPNARPAALHLKLSRAYGGRGGTLTKYPRKVESSRATMAVHTRCSCLCDGRPSSEDAEEEDA